MAKKGTEVHLPDFRYCDFDKANGKMVIASYDAKTSRFSPGRGSWGYMCQEHWEAYTDKQLGVGVGQKLIYPDAKPSPTDI